MHTRAHADTCTCVCTCTCACACILCVVVRGGGERLAALKQLLCRGRLDKAHHLFAPRRLARLAGCLGHDWVQQLALCGHDKARWCEPRADGARDLATCSSHSVALLSAQLAKASEPSAHMAQYSLKILCSWREVCRGGRPSSAQAALRRLVPVREQSAPQASCMCMHMSCACTCYMCMCMSMCKSM